MLEREQQITAYRRLQPVEELERKALVAKRRGHWWTQEEVDLAFVKAMETALANRVGVDSPFWHRHQ